MNRLVEQVIDCECRNRSGLSIKDNIELARKDFFELTIRLGQRVTFLEEANGVLQEHVGFIYFQIFTFNGYGVVGAKKQYHSELTPIS